MKFRFVMPPIVSNLVTRKEGSEEREEREGKLTVKQHQTEGTEAIFAVRPASSGNSSGVAFFIDFLQGVPHPYTYSGTILGFVLEIQGLAVDGAKPLIL
ncbi:hypothetical protein AXG93_4368s1610 [Marchantia polymorpha subsp. ruderalis]|uniref:Uncharacterized protein n=1 Tax=Marchantia polymorpha subsp. ruderalis TaxID=1480154 RepID=A0A176VZG7_MARPO|nr:hypothetical protein AXG93_4368s1610 [Marchantia polymorpha subsp. ruderalis]